MRFIKSNPIIMKKLIYLIAFLFTTAVLFSSCSVSKLSKFELKPEVLESKELFSGTFVKLKDGSVVNYNSLKIVKKPFSSPHLLANGKIKIKGSQIIAYQNEDHYAVSQNIFSSGRKSFIAKRTLPGFAVRLVKGKINVYCKPFYNGNAAIDEYFIQSSLDGKIQTFSPELMQRMLQDNKIAFDYFMGNDTNEEASVKIQTAVELYNNNVIVTKN